MLIRMQCPACGAAVNFDDTREFMFCSYCGTKIVNAEANKPVPINNAASVPAQVVYVQNTVDNANLYIEYTTLRPQYNLMVQNRRERWYFGPGEKQSFTLDPGKHVLRFWVAGHAWDKVIVIPWDNTPVNIRVDYSRRVQIFIDQPRWK